MDENTQPRELTSDELDLVSGGDFTYSVSFNNIQPNEGTQIALVMSNDVVFGPFSFSP